MDRLLFFLGIIFSFILSGSKSAKDESSDSGILRIHSISEPDMLNPTCYQDAVSGYIMFNIFQQLTAYDYKTKELVGVLAEGPPKLFKKNDKVYYSYRLRDGAYWDNEKPITARDVEFSLKVIKCPGVDNENNKPYYDFISDFIYDPVDSLKFTIVAENAYILGEISSGDIAILPQHVYDPKNRLKDFSVSDFNSKQKTGKDIRIKLFATTFNDVKYQKEIEFINGSGAYELSEWLPANEIVLLRKKKWWGDKYAGVNTCFDAFPKKIVYKVINDQLSASVELKQRRLDVMYGVSPDIFVVMREDNSKDFNFYTPRQLAYTYIGLNKKREVFSDKLVRQAMAHLVPTDSLLGHVMNGLGERVVGFVHPGFTKTLNQELKPYQYNLNKARELLNKAGWKDTDNDGILDKTFTNSKGIPHKVRFSVEFNVNVGNETRKQTALAFKENARLAGIEVNIIQLDWSLYLERCKSHEFDMYFGAWLYTPTPFDPKQIYHSESSNGGSNYVSFGNKESDALIDSIRFELEESKRIAMYKRLQAILYDEVSYIYLWAPYERIIVSKKFKSADVSIIRPGFWAASFK
jgi:peptide/nickel transport system substrate-binding protein